MWLTTILIGAVLLAILSAIIVKDLVVAKKTGVHYTVRNTVTSYLLLIPATVLAFIFVMLPIVYSLGYSFTDFELGEEMHFNNVQNFVDMYKNLVIKGDLYYSIINTAKFVVGVVPLQIGLALGLALFVNRPQKTAGIFKVCYFAPVVISLTVTSFLWLHILNGSEKGLFNMILGVFGIDPVDYLRDKDGAIWWIVLLSAWQGCGYQMLIFLSGLANIRKELYEAASLDGANVVQQFFNITLPSLRSTLLFVVITVFVGACRIMVQPMLMTGYEQHTMTLSYYMYYQGKYYGFVGYSSAVALIMTVVMGVITFLQRWLLREKD